MPTAEAPAVDDVKRFNALTPAQQRVEVALDVISQITDEVYIPHTGNFVSFPPKFSDRIKAAPLNKKDVHQLFCDNSVMTNCCTCALGAAFCSIVRKSDRYSQSAAKSLDGTTSGSRIFSKIVPILKRVFTLQQIILIESAFELGEGYFGNVDKKTRTLLKKARVSRKATTEAAVFGEKFARTDERLIAIMKNIVQNKGAFKP